MSTDFVLSSEDTRTTIRIPPNTVLRLGRAPDNDVVLKNPTVARYQATVRHELAGLTVEDAGSPGGTFVNDEAIREPVRLFTGDRIRLGGLTLVVG